MTQVSCSACGKPNAFGARYCWNCARELSYQAPNQSPYPPLPAVNQSSLPPVAKAVLFILCMGFVAVAVLIAIETGRKRRPVTPAAPAAAIDSQNNGDTFTKSGYFGDYRYTYRLEEERAVAMFEPYRLPHNNAKIVEAGPPMILNIFGEPVTSYPAPVGRFIVFIGRAHNYTISPVLDDSGLVRAFVIERVKAN